MKKSCRIIMLIGTVLFLTPLTDEYSSATGLMTCDSGDKASWQSIQVLEKKMLSEGWSVRRIKEDGGCYEAYGTTPEGQRVEAYFHPVTLEKLLVVRRGQILFRKEN